MSSARVGAVAASSLPAFEPNKDCPKSKCVEERRGEADAVDSESDDVMWLLVAGAE